MPEGMENGYQPSAEEMKLGQEHVESLSLTERQLFETSGDGQAIGGIEQIDDLQRVAFRREEYASGSQQAIQYEYLADGGVTEQGKMLAGEKAGQEYQREHPMSSHRIALAWVDEEIGTIGVEVPAVLETLGSTRTGDDRQPWAHFEVTDPDALRAFADVVREPSQNTGVIKQPLAENVPLTVNGREILVNINKASVDFGTNGQPAKVTLHSYGWQEVPKSDQ